jgi:hypothetical protein
MLDLTTALQYLFLSVFMQFVPLNETEIGAEHRYTISDRAYNIVVRTDNIRMENAQNLEWEFTVYYDGDEAPKLKHKAVLGYTRQYGLHLKSFKRDTLNYSKGGKTAKFPNKEEALRIGTEKKGVVPIKDTYEAELETSIGKLSAQIHEYESDQINIKVWHDEMFGLMQVEISLVGVLKPIVFKRTK